MCIDAAGHNIRTPDFIVLETSQLLRRSYSLCIYHLDSLYLLVREPINQSSDLSILYSNAANTRNLVKFLVVLPKSDTLPDIAGRDNLAINDDQIELGHC